MRPTLSLIIPIFNEEEVIPELDRRLKAVTESWSDLIDSWEVVFIDDGSKDKSLGMLRELAKLEPRYKVLSFARNFGHQVAITAGMDFAEGEAVVVMDADLQDPPEVVRQMLQEWRKGSDVVFAVRGKRHGETLFKRVTAAAYYRILTSMLGGFSIPLDAGDFRLMSRPVIMAMRALKERHRFVRGMVAWVGFKQTSVRYDRPARFAGETKYPLRRMLKFAIDGITSFSVVPLRFATWLGVFAGLVSVALAFWAVYVKFYAKGVVQGWTTLMIMVGLGTSAQLLMTGVVGEYVGRIYEEIKRRPLYIIAERINTDGDSPDKP